MKKVTLTFIVSDDVVEELSNELSWGNYGNVATIFEEEAEESDYNIEDYNI